MITNLDDYKTRVLDVARRLKEEQGWCDSGFREAMRELEIEIPPNNFEMVLTVEIIVRAERTDSCHEPSEDFIRSSIRSVELELELELDSDWDNEHVESWTLKEVDVTRISDL